ncbi:effector-associated constant component EACC1 [Amycolatopsis rubida]|uniref:effector-associated constant component EACC1 n=1 Tax=Amycolatopsis rubida TaxID=112413 RepID=UPI003CC7A445
MTAWRTRLRDSCGIRAARRGDELRSLHDWLSREDELCGRVRCAHDSLEPGQRGGMLDALVVAAGPGGMGAVLAGTLSSWIAHRRSDIKVTITSEDGRKVELDGHRERGEQRVATVPKFPAGWSQCWRNRTAAGFAKAWTGPTSTSWTASGPACGSRRTEPPHWRAVTASTSPTSSRVSPTSSPRHSTVAQQC